MAETIGNTRVKGIREIFLNFFEKFSEIAITFFEEIVETPSEVYTMQPLEALQLLGSGV